VIRALASFLLVACMATAAVAAPKDTGPQWASLTAEQQQILAPLQADWDKGLTKDQRIKWIGITKRYPGMTPKEQARIQARMQKWAKLTPAQRAQAREQYRALGKITPERREELRQYWADYQALPPEEKRMFDVPPSYVKPSERRKRAPAKKPGSIQAPATPL
jgi:hypothetical protein